METFLKLVAIIIGPIVVIFYAIQFLRDPNTFVIIGKGWILGFGIGFLLILIWLCYIVIKSIINSKINKVDKK